MFVALLAWCAALVVVRNAKSGNAVYSFLLWNLALAMIPAVAASIFAAANRRGWPVLVQTVPFAAWLLFLPNAPYIVTDFIHLAPDPRVPLWFDIAVLVSSAATGLLLGYASVAVVQTVFARAWGRAAGWGLAIAALMMSGFGIYAGRFLRWNSWDAVARPHAMASYAQHAAQTVADGAHLRSLGVTAIYGGGLVLGYVALRVFASTLVRRGDERRA